MKRPSVTAYLVLVFLSGLLLGAVGVELYNARAVNAERRFGPEEMRKRYVEEMRTRLKLRADQVEQLNTILDDTGDRYRELREKYRPEVRAIQDSQVEKIRSLLDDTQKLEYERMREERERHRAPGKGRGKGRPGPPC